MTRTAAIAPSPVRQSDSFQVEPYRSGGQRQTMAKLALKVNDRVEIPAPTRKLGTTRSRWRFGREVGAPCLFTGAGYGPAASRLTHDPPTLESDFAVERCYRPHCSLIPGRYGGLAATEVAHARRTLHSIRHDRSQLIVSDDRTTGERPDCAGGLRRCHPPARRGHLGLGRQGDLGHGRVRPVADRGEHPGGLGGQHRSRRRPLRHGRGLRQGRERTHRRPAPRPRSRPCARGWCIASKYMPSPWKPHAHGALVAAARKSARAARRGEHRPVPDPRARFRCAPTGPWRTRWPRPTARGS